MSDGVAAPGEYVHPVPAALEAVETALAECVGAPLWSLSVAELDDLVARSYALLGRVMGSLVLPLVREADRRDQRRIRSGQHRGVAVGSAAADPGGCHAKPPDPATVSLRSL